MNPWCLAGNLQVNLYTSGIHVLEQAKDEVHNLVVIPVCTNLQPFDELQPNLCEALSGGMNTGPADLAALLLGSVNWACEAAAARPLGSRWDAVVCCRRCLLLSDMPVGSHEIGRLKVDLRHTAMSFGSATHD